jgi:hypothetical protein
LGLGLAEVTEATVAAHEHDGGVGCLMMLCYGHVTVSAEVRWYSHTLNTQTLTETPTVPKQS